MTRKPCLRGSGTGAPREIRTPRPTGRSPRPSGRPRAFHRGAYRACWRGIQTLLPILHRLGGSHAQRDLFVQLMLAAAAEDGAQSTFTTLLAERQRTVASTSSRCPAPPKPLGAHPWTGI